MNIRAKLEQFLSDCGFARCVFLFTGLLIVFNFGVLTNPPYWDDLIGLHNQALFLAKHAFSPAALWAEPACNVYPFGILPWVYGVGYVLFPAWMVHFFGHLLNLAALGGSAAFFFLLVRKNWKSVPAFLWTLAVLSEPLVAGQGASLGQECPLLFGLTGALFLIYEKRFSSACIVIFLTGFLKASACVFMLAMVLYLLIRFCFFVPERRRLILPFFLALGGFVLLFLISRYHIPAVGAIGASAGTETMNMGPLPYLFRKTGRYMTLFHPLLLILSSAAFLLYGFFAFRERDREKRMFRFFLLLSAGGYFGAYLLSSVALPRYLLPAVFPVFLLLCTEIPERFSMPAGYALVALGLLCPVFVYPALPHGIRASGEYLERSREFLTDLRRNRELCRKLENDYADSPLVVSHPLAQMLTIPEFGYVKRPLPKVFCAKPPVYAPIRKTSRHMPPDTVYIYQEHSMEFGRMHGPSLKPPPSSLFLFVGPGLAGYRLPR